MAPLSSFALVLVGTVVSGAGGGLVWVFSTQLLMHQVRTEVRGRVFATEFALLSLLSAAGAALTGLALDPLGISGVVWTMAVLLLVPGTLWAGWIALRR
jgi:predicted MFS family arabinose efflux permease